MIVKDHVKDANLLDFYHILRRCVDQNYQTLTIRQLIVLLTCYLFDEDHTVRGLAVRLRVAKPAVSRMLDHLVEEGLIERRADPRDRRSILFERTHSGRAFIERIGQPVHRTVATSRQP